jgi:hypothetical protein
MKCVQVVGQGIPVRLSDDDAFQIVRRDFDGEYCPKRVFKEYRKSYPSHPAHSRITWNGKRSGRIVNVD